MHRIVAPVSSGWVFPVVLGWLAAAAPAAPAAPLTLEASVHLALENNLAVERARTGLELARADVTSARSAFLPTLTANGNWTRSEEPRLFEQGGTFIFRDRLWSARGDANLLLFDGYGNVANYCRARRDRVSARAAFRKAQQEVVYETERRFFEVRKQAELLKVNEEAVKLSGEQLKKTRAMKDLGAATQADVLKAQVDHSNNRLSVLRSERDVEVAKAALATYLGLDPREDVELADENLDAAGDFLLEAAMERALEINPTLAGARAAWEADRSGVTAAKSDRYPSVSVWGSTNYFNFELADFDDRHVEWQYGIRLDLTIFDGLRTKANIRRAQAELLASRRNVESSERDVLFAVRQAYLDLEIARQSITVAEEAVRSSEEDLRLAQERYKIGEGTILDVIDAQVNLTRSRTNLVNLTYDRRLAISALRNAIGDTPVPEPGG